MIHEYVDRFPNIKNPLRKIYAGMISSMDDGVGKIIDKLKEENIYDNTIVFFLSEKMLNIIQNMNLKIALLPGDGIGPEVIKEAVKIFLLVMVRTKHFINAFGEEVIIDNVEKALEKVITKHQCKIVDYTVAPRFMKSGKKGNHDWIIEFSKEPKSINDFMSDLDLSIQQNNTDYKAKRFKNITLDKPILHMARENLFYDWLKSKNKVGGQNKIPRLSNDRSFFEELIKMN